MSSNNDSGLAINRDNFDLKLDSGGDVAATANEQEMLKDLTLQIRLYFKRNLKGEVLNDTRLRTIETQIEEIVSSDARVESVASVSIRKRSDDRYPAVDISARTVYGFNEFQSDPNAL